jgi:hypothetical protein
LSRFLHIVCLDAPSPPDYGGAIDMFYKIKSLAALGVKVTLHYFNYKENRNTKGLEEYCYKIIAYKRKTGIGGITFNKPYIVASRINEQLIDNLNDDSHPILLEGYHCTGILPFINRQDKEIIIRVHNDEAVYYNLLALSERNWIKKAYYKTESILLQNYQRTLSNFYTYACISELDKERLERKYAYPSIQYIPCFVPWQKVEALEGIGAYALYHGNLAVAENKEAAKWVIQNVFSKINFPLIIAGKNASKEILALVKRYSNISVIDSPSTSKMYDLVRNAHLHVLPSKNQTGVKLKLINACFNGRFCITNKSGVLGSGLERACYIAETADEYINLINALEKVPFTQKELSLRQELLHIYNNEINARKFIKMLNYTSVI